MLKYTCKTNKSKQITQKQQKRGLINENKQIAHRPGSLYNNEGKKKDNLAFARSLRFLLIISFDPSNISSIRRLTQLSSSTWSILINAKNTNFMHAR